MYFVLQLTFHHEKKSCQELKQRPWRNAAYWLAPYALLPLPLFIISHHEPRVTLATMAWFPPTSIKNQANLRKLFFQQSFPLPRCVPLHSLCQVDEKKSQLMHVIDDGMIPEATIHIVVYVTSNLKVYLYNLQCEWYLDEKCGCYRLNFWVSHQTPIFRSWHLSSWYLESEPVWKQLRLDGIIKVESSTWLMST